MSKRSKFAGLLATNLGVTKKQGDIVLMEVVKAINQLIVEDGQVIFPKIGRLKVHTRSARKGHNPRTGQAIDIPEKSVLKFHEFK